MPVDLVVQASLEVAISIICVQALIIKKLLMEQ
jgi:hypothetical protein